MSLDDLLRHPALWRAREQGEAAGRPGPAHGVRGARPLPARRRLAVAGAHRDPHRPHRHRRAEPAAAGARAAVRRRAARAAGSPGSHRRTRRMHRRSPPAASTSSRILVVRAPPAEWAMEQALRSGACSAVLGWAACRERQSLRRLQLAAEQSRCLAVLFRRLRGRAASLRPRCCASRSRATRDGLEVAHPEEPRRACRDACSSAGSAPPSPAHAH